MREGTFFCEVEPEILCEGDHAPEGRELAAFSETRDHQVERQHYKIGRKDAKRSFKIKFSIRYGLVFCYPGEELAADEVAAEDEEEVYAGPAPTAEVVIESGGVAEHIVVINEYDDDGQGTKMIQAGEAPHIC